MAQREIIDLTMSSSVSTIVDLTEHDTPGLAIKGAGKQSKALSVSLGTNGVVSGPKQDKVDVAAVTNGSNGKPKKRKKKKRKVPIDQGLEDGEIGGGDPEFAEDFTFSLNDAQGDDDDEIVEIPKPPEFSSLPKVRKSLLDRLGMSESQAGEPGEPVEPPRKRRKRSKERERDNDRSRDVDRNRGREKERERERERERDRERERAREREKRRNGDKERERDREPRREKSPPSRRRSRSPENRRPDREDRAPEPPTSEPPTNAELFFVDTGPSDIPDTYQVTLPNAPNGNTEEERTESSELLLPSNVRLETGDVTIDDLLPSIPVDSEDEGGIEFLEYDDARVVSIYRFHITYALVNHPICGIQVNLTRYFEDRTKVDEEEQKANAKGLICKRCQAEGEHRTSDCPVLIVSTIFRLSGLCRYLDSSSHLGMCVSCRSSLDSALHAGLGMSTTLGVVRFAKFALLVE